MSKAKIIENWKKRISKVTTSIKTTWAYMLLFSCHSQCSGQNMKANFKFVYAI